eukprot:TRINITY_DN523_c0_g1_i6.p1 TRINITY_DN523_c0_g1~~TRINITY_DN523_c0_g1_i6.p1  ORF type:complete len:112 (+),score=2.83 TRINITY_DN523_c0_g1_i6:126-461(+)
MCIRDRSCSEPPKTVRLVHDFTFTFQAWQFPITASRNIMYHRLNHPVKICSNYEWCRGLPTQMSVSYCLCYCVVYRASASAAKLVGTLPVRGSVPRGRRKRRMWGSGLWIA